MRIAHISDLHFSKISKGIGQFFSKAWIGNINLLFNRSYDFSPICPHTFTKHLKHEKVTTIIISGDLTTTSSKTEFRLAKAFIDYLTQAGFQVYVIPGNHDHYTKLAYRRKTFYQYFSSNPNPDFSYNLAEHGITAKKLMDHWWLVLMDTALATPLTSSTGYFSKSIETTFKNLLKELPSEDKILLVNHFPFFQHDRPKRCLKRGPVLEEIIRTHPNIKIYLHGHTHRRCIADLRVNGLPLVCDSGSIAYYNSSWNLLDLTDQHCHLTAFGKKGDHWSEIERHEFRWENE